MIRAVLFDLDDTLFDHAYCARAALDGVRSEHQSLGLVPPEVLERAHAEILEVLHAEVMLGRLELDAARIERFRRLFASAGVEADRDAAAAAAATYRRHYLESRREVEGAAALLAAARERAQVGIVSNNLRNEQQDKLRCCGLDRYIDALVVSEEAGVSKPDPRIFEMALQRLDCRPEEAVMLGDSWAADIVGAAAAGIRPVWFNRGGGVTPPIPAGVAVIGALAPAADVLDVLFEITRAHGTARQR
jgi:putative hydrolase of the HAD superfamily